MVLIRPFLLSLAGHTPECGRDRPEKASRRASGEINSPLYNSLRGVRRGLTRVGRMRHFAYQCGSLHPLPASRGGGRLSGVGFFVFRMVMRGSPHPPAPSPRMGERGICLAYWRGRVATSPVRQMLTPSPARGGGTGVGCHCAPAVVGKKPTLERRGQGAGCVGAPTPPPAIVCSCYIGARRV